MDDQTDAEAHHAWLMLMMTQPEKAALAAHHIRAQLTQAQAEIARLRRIVEEADKMREDVYGCNGGNCDVRTDAYDQARAGVPKDD